MAIYHQILWLQASPKFTSVPAMVKVSVIWTGSGIDLNHFNTKKGVFSLLVFPYQRLDPLTVLGLGPTASRDATALREGHTGRAAGFWDAHFAHREQQEAAGQSSESSAGGRAGAGTQLLSRTLREGATDNTRAQPCHAPAHVV